MQLQHLQPSQLSVNTAPSLSSTVSDAAATYHYPSKLVHTDQPVNSADSCRLYPAHATQDDQQRLYVIIILLILQLSHHAFIDNVYHC